MTMTCHAANDDAKLSAAAYGALRDFPAEWVGVPDGDVTILDKRYGMGGKSAPDITIEARYIIALVKVDKHFEFCYGDMKTQTGHFVVLNSASRFEIMKTRVQSPKKNVFEKILLPSVLSKEEWKFIRIRGCDDKQFFFKPSKAAEPGVNTMFEPVPDDGQIEALVDRLNKLIHAVPSYKEARKSNYGTF